AQDGGGVPGILFLYIALGVLLASFVSAGIVRWLRQNARQIIAAPGPFMPHLYLNTGHGSRGLTSTPLAA
ncbi:MAG: hypothetical protein P8X52_01810, partial [Limibacillus sp.]